MARELDNVVSIDAIDAQMSAETRPVASGVAVMLTLANTGQSGDPNTIAAVPKINLARPGTKFLDDDTGIEWTKKGPLAADWEKSIGSISDSQLDETVGTMDGTPKTIVTYATKGDNRTIALSINVWAREPLSGASARFVIESTFGRDGSSVVTEDFIDNVSYFSPNGWDLNLVVSGQDILIQVVGEPGKTINWRCQLEVSEHV